MCIFLLRNKVNFTKLELNRLIENYKDMIVEINGVARFYSKTLSEEEKAEYPQISLESVLKKLHEFDFEKEK